MRRPVGHVGVDLGCGLLIGQAVREDWRAILGDPDETMIFTDSMAYDYGLPVGESDVYHFGEHELRIHADADGVLRLADVIGRATPIWTDEVGDGDHQWFADPRANPPTSSTTEETEQ